LSARPPGHSLEIMKTPGNYRVSQASARSAK
jgi:hypothetical protein